MSHTHGAVRFDDGLVLFFEYNGTSDICRPLLYKTTQEVSDNWRSIIPEKTWVDGTNTEEPVEIFVDYGGGFCWNGKADRHMMLITQGWDAWDPKIGGPTDGIPDWAKEVGF